jgi:hypothetical protein
MSSPQRSQRIEDLTRAMFTRVLSGWAMDLLELRRTGLIVPCARDGGSEPVMPSWSEARTGPLTLDRRWPASDVAASLQWQTRRRAA